MYHILWDLACIDGVVSPEELEILRRIVPHLRLHASLFSWECGQRGVASGDDGEASRGAQDPYEVLGCARTASDDDINDQYGTISMPHVNTNFHGRLLLSQVAVNAGDPISPYRLKTYIWDARNLGGAYTASNDTYCAITLKNNPSIVVTNDVTFSEPTRGMLIEAGGQFNIGNGKTMRMENQITFAGALDKTGLGTLDLAGAARFIDGATSTAPSAGTNVLTVSQGALRISSAEAADGLAISFAEGTRLVIPAASEKGYCNTKWNAPLTINTNDGTLPVVIDVTGVDASNIEVPICTFNATTAENIPETVFAVQRISSAIRCKGVEKRTNADGSVSYVARIGMIGTQLFFR